MWRSAIMLRTNAPLRRSMLPLVTAASATFLWTLQSQHSQEEYSCTATTHCEAAASASSATDAVQALGVEKANLLDKVSNSWMRTSAPTTTANNNGVTPGGSMRPKTLMGAFYRLFPLRQLWKPAVDYPMWDANWDGKGHGDTAIILHEDDATMTQGKVRHLILIPHGQDDATIEVDQGEEDDEEEAAHLTKLGRQQAEQTGARLAQLLADKKDTDIVLRVSDQEQAIETAQIVAQYLPMAQLPIADPLLKEGRPCHNLPGHRVYHIQIQAIDREQPRIEQAFRKYFYRPDTDMEKKDSKNNKSKAKNNDDEVEILVGHPNVLRYFLCRALQLPPETYGRYALAPCSLTYVAIYPNGVVSCRTVGEAGHLASINTKVDTNNNNKERFLW